MPIQIATFISYIIKNRKEILLFLEFLPTIIRSIADAWAYLKERSEIIAAIDARVASWIHPGRNEFPVPV